MQVHSEVNGTEMKAGTKISAVSDGEPLCIQMQCNVFSILNVTIFSSVSLSLVFAPGVLVFLHKAYFQQLTSVSLHLQSPLGLFF